MEWRRSDGHEIPAARRAALGTWLVANALDRPAVGTSGQLLVTLDAHALYARFGFSPVRDRAVGWSG